jgi:hypothetical protein
VSNWLGGAVAHEDLQKHVPVRDEAFKEFVRGLGCLLEGVTACDWSECSDPDHAGGLRAGSGKGQKADDTTCIPLCRKHHRERQEFGGYFKGWDKERMHAWCDAAIDATQLAYDKHVRGVTL